ncbi:MAG TPA: inorganic phosphate transporter, partial [Bacillota bacterium]
MPTKLQPPPLHINCRKGEGTTILVWLGWLASLFFAMNIGASAAAASMGSVYGAHVLRRRTALLLVAIFSLLGAYFGGGEVIKTISGGIVDGDRIDLPGAVAIIASAAMTLLVANLWGVPLSTSEVTVGAVIGAGLVVGGIRSAEVTRIVLTWAIF